jgi:hypothetical protein
MQGYFLPSSPKQLRGSREGWQLPVRFCRGATATGVGGAPRAMRTDKRRETAMLVFIVLISVVPYKTIEGDTNR